MRHLQFRREYVKGVTEMAKNICLVFVIFFVLVLQGCSESSAPDQTPPIITLSPSSTSYNLTVGDDIPSITATAFDDVDGDISSEIVVSGDVINNQSEGTYIVAYNVTDSAGNKAQEVTIVFNYTLPPDTQAPLISITPNTQVYNLTVGDEIPVITVTAYDERDGDISEKIETGGDTVNNQAAGSYIITYNVVDDAGNQADEVLIRLNFDHPEAPDGSFALFANGDEITNNTLTISEAELIAFSLKKGNSVPYSSVRLVSKNDLAINFASIQSGWNQWQGSDVDFFALDAKSSRNIYASFGELLYAQFPHVSENLTQTLRLEFLASQQESSHEVLYVYDIQIQLLDNGSVPESGFMRENFEFVDAPSLLAYDFYVPYATGTPTYDEFYGVSLSSGVTAESFVKTINGSYSDSVATPSLDNTPLDNLIIEKGFTLDIANNQLIIPQLSESDLYGVSSSSQSAEVKPISADTCNYFDGFVITPQGIVDENGMVISTMEGLCHIGNRQNSNEFYVLDEESMEVKSIDIKPDGTIDTVDFFIVDNLPSYAFDIVLFNESGLVLQEQGSSGIYSVFLFSANSDNEPLFLEPVTITESSVSDILVTKNQFGIQLLVANPQEDFVSLYHNLEVGELIKEKITFNTPIEWMDLSTAPSDIETRNFVVFGGRNAGGIYSKHNFLINTYD